MTVAAVVVRWRGGDEVDHCLRSLLDQSGGELRRIILVDSGSGDGGAERLASTFPEVGVIALDENRSFAHAANTGVRGTDEDFVLLLNPDTELEPIAVSGLVDAAGRRPAAAGVVPLLVNPDGTSQHRWQLRRLPTAARLATGRSGAAAFSDPPTVAAPVEQPAAATWLVRNDVWRSLDGLDETFAPAWWEDTDFCARLARRLGSPGFPAREGFVVAPAVSIRHRGGSSVSELDPAAFLSAFAGNLLLYAERHHSGRLPAIRAGLRISLVARALLRPSRLGTYLGTARRI